MSQPDFNDGEESCAVSLSAAQQNLWTGTTTSSAMHARGFRTPILKQADFYDGMQPSAMSLSAARQNLWTGRTSSFAMHARGCRTPKSG